MGAVTGVIRGILLPRRLPAPSRLGGALAVTRLALLPDSDYFLVGVDTLAFIRIQRSLTHSLLAVLLLVNFCHFKAAAGCRAGAPTLAPGSG